MNKHQNAQKGLQGSTGAEWNDNGGGCCGGNDGCCGPDCCKDDGGGCCGGGSGCC